MPNYAFSQMVRQVRIDKYDILDTATFKIIYDVDIVNSPGSNKYLDKDVLVLLIGKHVSKSFSQRLFKADSVYTDLIRKDEDFPSFTANIPYMEVFKDFTNSKLIVTDRGFSQDPIFKYEEGLVDFKWKISNERKTILSYPCHKAVTTFRGRTYEVWFTTFIPFNDGPYKFSGLPGLILEVSDTKSEFVIKCISLQKLKNRTPIKMWDLDYETTTREKLQKFLQQIHNRPGDHLKSLGVSFCTLKDGKVVPMPLNFKFPYNPMELE